jgi:hypothetical protein
MPNAAAAGSYVPKSKLLRVCRMGLSVFCPGRHPLKQQKRASLISQCLLWDHFMREVAIAMPIDVRLQSASVRADGF